MNKQMKQHLEAVVSALVEQDNAAAKSAFHDYLRLKSQSILLGEADDEKDDEDKKDDKKADEGDESDDKKADKKDDKKADEGDESDDKKKAEDC